LEGSHVLLLPLAFLLLFFLKFVRGIRGLHEILEGVCVCGGGGGGGAQAPSPRPTARFVHLVRGVGLEDDCFI
jgi:hypothetical protein